MSPDSRSPVISVRPSAKAPRISALWEMDLSPGTEIVPCKAPDLRDITGFGAARTWDIGRTALISGIFVSDRHRPVPAQPVNKHKAFAAQIHNGSCALSLTGGVDADYPNADLQRRMRPLSK